MATIVIEEHGPFRVELEYEDDEGFEFDYYGKFCELPSRDQMQSRAHNDPKGGHFYVRNPGAWRKRMSSILKVETWERMDLSVYGWFRLAEHPRFEVEALMKDGLTEKEAWEKALARWPDLIRKLASNEIQAMWLKVEVFWNDEVVGEEAIGGIEVEKFIGDEGAKELAREHGLIDSALAMAKKEINKMYGVAPTAPNNEAHTAPDNAAMSGKE